MSRYREMDNSTQSISLVIHTVVTVAVKYVGEGEAMFYKATSIQWKLWLEGARGLYLLFLSIQESLNL